MYNLSILNNKMVTNKIKRKKKYILSITILDKKCLFQDSEKLEAIPILSNKDRIITNFSTLAS